jgi:peroxiredoxin
VGAGLILLGAALFFILPKPGQPAAAGSQPASEISAIPVTVDFPAPELQLTNLQGQAVSLADYRGQFVLLNNWATWCPPCKAEMPALQQFFDDHRQQDFTIIAVDMAEPAALVEQFVAQNGLTFEVWLDPQEKVYQAFRNFSLPTSWLIDPQGQVRMTWSGAISREMLEKTITPLLEE